MKAIGVALNPIPAADVLGGSAVDATMVVTLATLMAFRSPGRTPGS